MSTVMIWQTRSSGSAATEQLGALLGRLIKKSLVIELRSDLGGGKTTFVRGLAKGLGVKAAVTSPSFTLSQEYPARSGMMLYHFDFYRLSDSGVLAGQLAEAIQNPKAVAAVEWSDIVKKVLPQKRLIIEFKPTADNSDERDILFTYSAEYVNLIRQLETDSKDTQP